MLAWCSYHLVRFQRVRRLKNGLFGDPGGNENRLEKNIGLNYGYKFWNACLLGIGHCETVSPGDRNKPMESKQEGEK